MQRKPGANLKFTKLAKHIKKWWSFGKSLSQKILKFFFLGQSDTHAYAFLRRLLIVTKQFIVAFVE